MARLCVRVGRNASTRSQPGDVISVAEDDHVWSKAELSCGQYVFLEAPGIPASSFAQLTIPSGPLDQDVTIKVRANQLNPKNLADVTGRAVTKVEIDAITVVKG